MTNILRHVAEAIPPARQGKLPSSHRHCYQYLNGAKLRTSNMQNDDSIVGLPDVLRTILYLQYKVVPTQSAMRIMLHVLKI